MEFVVIRIVRRSALKIVASKLALMFVVSIGCSKMCAQIPGVVHYQGRVMASGVAFSGTGSFKFSLLSADSSGVYWSNSPDLNSDGEPDVPIAIYVAGGGFSIYLGDTNVAGMALLPPAVFTNADLYLRIWFGDATNHMQRLTPDQRLGTSAYSMMAASVADSAITPAKLATKTPGTLTASLTARLDALTAQLTTLSNQVSAVSNSAGNWVSGGTALGPSGDTTGATDLANLNAALACGGLVVLANGDYYWGAVGNTGTINSMVLGTRLTGQGYGSKVHTDMTLVCTSETEIDHFGMYVRSSLARDGSGCPTAAYSARVKFLKATDVKAHDMSGDGLVIEFNGVSGFEAVDNHFSAGYSWMGGIEGYNGSISGRVRSNDVRYSNHNGIGWNACADIITDDNICHLNHESGISPQNSCTGMNIINNICNNNGADGIDYNPYPGGMNTLCDSKIQDNHCNHNGATGIYAVGSYIAIFGNTCYGNTTYGILTKRYLSDQSTASHVLVVGNQAQNNSSGGISLQDVSGPVTSGND